MRCAEVTIGVKGESEMCSRHEGRERDGKAHSKTQKNNKVIANETKVVFFSKNRSNRHTNKCGFYKIALEKFVSKAVLKTRH